MYIYIYIYVYMCVCVSMLVYFLLHVLLERDCEETNTQKSKQDKSLNKLNK
jgi:hypothetical protein